MVARSHPDPAELNTSPSAVPGAPVGSPVTWRWADALRGGLCALPALPLAFLNPSIGLAWAMGTLPVAMVPLPPSRNARRRLIGIGAVLAVSVLAGSLCALTAITTVIGIFVAAYASAVAASRAPSGLFALTLCLPVCAIGLSYAPSEAVALGAVFVASAVFSYVATLAWPEFTAEPSHPQPLLTAAFARRYGVLAGLAGATSALAGLAVHTDHLGWAPAAGYFVLRPSADMQRLRSTGRVISVACGAVAGAAFARTTPSAAAI